MSNIIRTHGGGDVEGILLLEMRDLDKLKSKLEIHVIMEKRMLDTCQHKYGLLIIAKIY